MTMKVYIVLIAIILFTPTIAALTCPIGLTNDTYPGSCRLYTDENKDNLCDYSQSPIPSEQINNTASSSKIMINYYFIYILMGSLALYLASYFLSKKNKISIVSHKKIWNFLLLISFIGTGLSGIILVLNLEYGINIALPLNTLFWHVETGIVMTIIGVFHALWHIPYFKSYIKK